MRPVIPWADGTPGVVRLPSGRLVRGRGLRRPPPAGAPATLAVHLAGRRPGPTTCEQQWIRWRDFWVPSDYDEARRVLVDAHGRAAQDRVEITCRGGVGRTGTALAALGILDGSPAPDAVRWVRATYHPRAVEVPWQRHFLRWLASPRRDAD
ncbi:MAG TPA: protein-tyrosine phosphatase family protein [Microlunatus sp.]